MATTKQTVERRHAIHVLRMTAGYFLAILQDKGQPVRFWKATGFVAFVWRGKNGSTYAGYEQGGRVVCYRGAQVNW